MTIKKLFSQRLFETMAKEKLVQEMLETQHERTNLKCELVSLKRKQKDRRFHDTCLGFVCGGIVMFLMIGGVLIFVTTCV